MVNSSMERWTARENTIGLVTNISMKVNTRIIFEMEKELTSSTRQYTRRVFGEVESWFSNKNDLSSLLVFVSLILLNFKNVEGGV